MKKLVVAGLVMVAIAVTTLVVGEPAFAEQIDPCSVSSSSSLCESNNDVTDYRDVVKVVVNTLLWLVGIVAVIMIIISGITYVTSGGGDGVKRAKTTLIWAVAGLVVAIFAYAIVNWIINELI